MTEKTKHYPDVSAKADFPQLERDILEYWRKDDTFAKSIANRDAGAKGSNEYVFYDGPPFANGLPHYGHLLTGYVKDIVPRYQTMRGHRVERRFGWDCHGLPIEQQVENKLGQAKKTMEKSAIREHCRAWAKEFIQIQKNEFKRNLPRTRADVHQRMEADRYPSGALGVV